MALFTLPFWFLNFTLLSLSLLCTPFAFSQDSESSKTECMEKERQALLQIKGTRTDQNGTHVFPCWSSKDRNCCEWQEVTCDDITGHIVKLDIVHCQGDEDGSISGIGEISHGLELKYLRSVQIHTISFLNPSIFSWLSNVSTNLVNLTLHRSQLKGQIPDCFENMKFLVNINLSDNELKGGVPRSLGELCDLKTLDISSNTLSVPFQDLLRNFSTYAKNSLEILRLSGNELYGSLQGITEFRSLTELYLDGNKLEGTLPHDFQNLPKLETLNLGGNKLDGFLPESLGRVSTLKVLNLESNNLDGVISEVNLCNVSSLQQLHLSDNSLTMKFSPDWVPPFQLNSVYLRSCKLGPDFPRWFLSQHNLLSIDISRSEISDEVPKWFWSLSSHLKYINMSFNRLRGEIPDLPLKYRTPLAIMDLSSNFFQGSLPRFFANWDALSLSNNKFTGCIRFLRTKYPKVSYLDLCTNLLSGELPDCFNQWSLIDLNLASNNFFGKIPGSLSSLTRIKVLHLSGNNFSGTLPSSLSSCTRLKILDIGYNKISGTIPIWIGVNLTSLIVLRLRSNEFYGAIPSNICQLSSLQVLDLSLNNLSGPIPHCIHKLMTTMSSNLDSEYIPNFSYAHLVYTEVVWKGIEHEYNKTLGLLRLIDLSCNRLTGEIPEGITRVFWLISLNLSNNSLVGRIPEDIGQLKALDSLDLSRNKISGEIPESLSQITSLGWLDLSYNNLSGKIPSGTQLQSFDASRYTGNRGLCGAPLEACNRERTTQKTSDSDDSSQDKIHNDEEWTESLYFGCGVGFFVGLLGFCAFLMFNRLWRLTILNF